MTTGSTTTGNTFSKNATTAFSSSSSSIPLAALVVAVADAVAIIVAGVTAIGWFNFP